MFGATDDDDGPVTGVGDRARLHRADELVATVGLEHDVRRLHTAGETRRLGAEIGGECLGISGWSVVRAAGALDHRERLHEGGELARLVAAVVRVGDGAPCWGGTPPPPTPPP